MPRGKKTPAPKPGNQLLGFATELGSRISACAKEVGGVRRLSELTEISESQLHRYISGDSSPTAAPLVAISRAAGVSINWLMAGESPMRPTAAPAQGSREDQAPYGLTRIPVFELRLSAGAGEPAWASEKPVGYLDVPTEFLAKHLYVSPAHAKAFPVSGESMDPTVRDGELAVMDSSIRTIDRDGAIYVFRRVDELSIKRVYKRGPVFLLKSDNPAFGEEQVPRSDFDEIQILGRVGGALRRV